MILEKLMKDKLFNIVKMFYVDKIFHVLQKPE
jgi:hypothetical protein